MPFLASCCWFWFSGLVIRLEVERADVCGSSSVHRPSKSPSKKRNESLFPSQQFCDLSCHLTGQHRAGSLVGLTDGPAAGHAVFLLEPGMQFLGQMQGSFFIMQHQAQNNRAASHRPADTTRTG